MSVLTNAQIRELKARAQLMKPMLKVGHDGLSAAFIAALDELLKHHALVKVKFSDFKEQKKELAPQLAEKTGSELIMRVGNVAVLYRPKPMEPDAGCRSGVRRGDEKISSRHQRRVSEQPAIPVQLSYADIVQFHSVVCHAVAVANDLREQSRG